MRRQKVGFDPARHLFVLCSIAFVLLTVFLLGLHAGATGSPVYLHLRDIYLNVGLVWSEKETITRVRPEWYLQPARYQGKGVTVNETGGDSDLLLIAGFLDGGPELRLIRRDGTVKARWPVSATTLFHDATYLPTPIATDWNADIHGMVALPDGSITFNVEHVGAVKLDRCSKLLWRMARVTHHAVEPAQGGGFWIPGRRYYPLPGYTAPDYSPFDTPHSEDTVLRVADDGSVLAEISIIETLVKNGLLALLTLNGNIEITPMKEIYRDGIDREVLHLNDIEELSPALAGAFPMFTAGDLMVSLRNRNLVLVFDPETLKVKWWHIGPWVRQHDPDFQPDGTITVFNNNRDSTSSGSRFGGSTIVKIDPKTNVSETLYGGRKGQHFYTAIRGKHRISPDGRILIVEHEAGRIFEVDATGRLIWEYINRYDENEALEVTDARRYPLDYFTVNDWSCPDPGA